MNEDVKKLWVDALRNGEYKGLKINQAEGALRKKDDEDGTANMCCLGVLNHIAADQGVGIKSLPPLGKDNMYVFEYTSPDRVGWEDYGNEELIPTVVEWAGLDVPNPRVKYEPLEASYKGNDPDDRANSLGVLISLVNDEGDADFGVIADLIEEQL